MFFLWLWLVSWVHEDAKAVDTNSELWTAIVFGAGAAGLIVWLLIPMFIIGILFYIILIAASSMSYVMHRNTLVMDYDRILTVDHIQGLFVKDEAKLEALKNFVFITSNRNEIPMPEGKTPEFFGFKSAYDLINDAIWRRAELINITPTQEEYNVIYHVDGAALKQPSILRQQMDYCVTFLKQVANLDVEEKRKPQQGKFSTRQENDITDWELLTAGSTAGEQIQIKLKTKKEISKIEDIGLSDKQIEQIKQVQQSKQGVFIVSGPPMSGVSTTFYAMIRHHDPFIYNINTVEKKPT
ncbi:MAG: ATPase, T2SS/T4P/T4SS family, partial [Planctomycetota bacterium]